MMLDVRQPTERMHWRTVAKTERLRARLLRHELIMVKRHYEPVPAWVVSVCRWLRQRGGWR